MLLGLYAIVTLLPVLGRAEIQTIQTWAVVVTGAVVLWYTWETMRLRRMAVRQAELQLRPYVVFSADGREFFVENVGAAVALNVHIDDVEIYSPARTDVRFSSRISVLRPFEKTSVEASVFVDGQASTDFLLAHLNPAYASTQRPVTVRFCNAEGLEYAVTFLIAPGKVEAGAVSPKPS